MPLLADLMELLPFHDIFDWNHRFVAKGHHETRQIRDFVAGLHTVVLHEQFLMLVPFPYIGQNAQ